MSTSSPGPENPNPDADGLVGGLTLWPSNVLPGPKYRFADVGPQTLSRTDFSLLFSRYGTQHGVGDGSTTFGLPDYTGMFPVGYNSADTDFNAVGKTGGAKSDLASISGTTGAGSAHSHGSAGLSVTGQGSFGVQSGASGNVQAGTNLDVGGSTDSESSHTHSFSGSDTVATVPPFRVTRFIIKVM